MTRLSLKRQFRDMLAGSYSLRCAIGIDIMSHERTIQRWATNDNPKLCSDFFLKSLRKHGNIDKSVELVEQVAINQECLA